MDIRTLQLGAGAISTAIFISSTLPMLAKASQTKDLQSYSLPSMALNTAGNLVHWIYISSLPVGPLWILHGFNTAVTLLMLLGHLAYRCHPKLLAAGRAPAGCTTGGRPNVPANAPNGA